MCELWGLRGVGGWVWVSKWGRGSTVYCWLPFFSTFWALVLVVLVLLVEEVMCEHRGGGCEWVREGREGLHSINRRSQSSRPSPCANKPQYKSQSNNSGICHIATLEHRVPKMIMMVENIAGDLVRQGIWIIQDWSPENYFECKYFFNVQSTPAVGLRLLVKSEKTSFRLFMRKKKDDDKNYFSSWKTAE